MRTAQAPSSGRLADELLPFYDTSDEVAVVVEADVATTWRALVNADLMEAMRRAPIAGLLGALRWLPELLGDLIHGERPPAAPTRLTLHDTAALPPGEGGWVLLGERPAETIALGLVGRFWRPVIDYAAVTADEFQEFAEPGYAKTIYVLSVRPLADGRTLLTGLMRTATTDDHARRWFRRYWTFGVGSGARVVVQALLELVREHAEHGIDGGEAARIYPS